MDRVQLKLRCATEDDLDVVADRQKKATATRANCNPSLPSTQDDSDYLPPAPAAAQDQLEREKSEKP